MNMVSVHSHYKYTCISVMQYHHDADELSKQKVALKILGRCFAGRSGKDMLNYMYQEYDVSSKQCNNIIWSTHYYYINLTGNYKHGNNFT